MNSYIKMLAIIAIVATLGTVSAMTTIIQIAKAQNLGSTYCDGKYSPGNSRDGCVSGQADCRGGKKYDPGKGHTAAFIKGYDAGWTHEGCKIPKSTS